MNWKIFFTSFWMIFLTEMGDKTQLANLSLTAESKTPVIVFSASILGYAAATLLAIVLGGVLSGYVPQHYIKTASGCLFVVIGALILSGIL